MGRLFWKFFFFIWLAQLTAIVGVGVAFWLRDGAEEIRAEAIDLSPPAAFRVEAAASTLEYGGPAALRGLLGNTTRHPIFAVDEYGRELLGRAVSAGAIAQAQGLAASAPDLPRPRRVAAADGHSYLLFVPMAAGHPVVGPLPGGERPPPPPGDRPRPPPGRHFPPWAPMAAAVVASFAFAGLLAWYFAKPIRSLRSAFDSAAAGNLDMQIGSAMGKRRDELADLGRDFDRMAGRLRTVMDGQRRLLHDVSHELRSPLARLQVAIGLVRQQPDKLETSIARIEREVVRMDRLVGELLTLARLEAGVLGAIDDEVDIEELLAGLIDDARFEAAAAGREVAFSGVGEISVRGQAELLHGAIENVLRNALRHTPEGGRVDVEARLGEGGREIRLSILDRGPGVAESELDSIFQAFQRGSGTVGSDGHGLGLAIARRVVELHGGSIGAANRPGGGLRVDIALPAARAGEFKASR